ncbi:MAG TPA: DUF2309 domain-containing protein [Nitrosomonas mobilis]|nr:DUF2309 domain-containing protein [Nitrosomonas mobilis]
MDIETSFDEHRVLHDLKHYLPAQAPLKDFIHHNTLHAFQNLKFHDACRTATKLWGYKTKLRLDEYRALYESGGIRKDVLRNIVSERKGQDKVDEFINKLINYDYDTFVYPRIGVLRANWESIYRIDLDQLTQPLLFRILCNYLDQGISLWTFPIGNQGFLAALRTMEKESAVSLFKKPRAHKMLVSGDLSISALLRILVGDETLYEQYLYDQQFSHQGWSGIVSVIEDQPNLLLNRREISLHDLIIFELLLEIDALDAQFGEIWAPMTTKLADRPKLKSLLADVPRTELDEVLETWHDAFEWSYYNSVLTALQKQPGLEENSSANKSFQAWFCIDDRETSLRRHMEKADPECETFSTAGFFGVEFYFQPEHGKFYAKHCPAPVTPKYLIKETETHHARKDEPMLSKLSHTLFRGWLISQTLGFVSALKLLSNIFRPTASPAMAYSFGHMYQLSSLTIENKDTGDVENGLQIGYTLEEMASRLENVLRMGGLVDHFAPIVYMFGHGASSINNPHYTAYDCGACSGRPGSVNARVISHIGNHPEVRRILRTNGINIPDSTQFVGALHDTTRDEALYFDEEALSPDNLERHRKNVVAITKALDTHAKERARRFLTIPNIKRKPEKVHADVRQRSVELFEPRPELNHSTIAPCVVGRRALTKNIFFDRRITLTSYDYRTDPEGNYLLMAMGPIAPVMAGINLEYFFSRMDNYRMGAGTKLPYNIMGLIGVANGSDGDLRPGLPSQMIEVHDPVRLLVVIEHYPEIVLKVLKKLPPANYEHYLNEWMWTLVIHPETRELLMFKNGELVPFKPIPENIEKIPDWEPIVESAFRAPTTQIVDTTRENLPVFFTK